ncbi:MAG: InlB B-repeat-containing protein [Coriobacteriia bacterium]|nr:InlB B-repeat-containing protein [Coriobacteriia bacterium]
MFALIAIASLGFFVYSNKKSGVKYGNYISNAGKATLTKSSKIAIAAFMIATLALCSVIFIPSITKAVAANDEADETVKVYVDTEAGTLTSEPTTIVNKTDKNAYIAAVQTTLTPDAEEILKDAKFNLKIESETLGTTLYNKEVPGVDDSIKSLPFAAGQKAQATLTITDLGLDTAKLLAGLNVFTVSFIEAECYVVSYDANGATSGTAPALQTKDPGKDITLAATTDLEKDGYTFEGWNTSADGSGTTYQLGATFSTDADTVLYAYWKENPTPPPPPPADTYRVTFVASTGGIVDAEYIDVDEGTTLVYTPTTGKLELKNQADQSTVKTVIATANTGFVFKQWELDGTAITTEGTINSASKFTAVFDKDIPISDYTITYKVLNTFDAHGSIALNSSNENGAPLVSETVTATHAAVGATASEEDHPEFGYYYFFDGWTIEDEAHSTWSCTDPCLSAEAIAALGLREDTIFIAHFIAPVAKYSEENSTMVFSCDEVIGDGNYTFPVYNSNWDEEFMQSGDFSLLTFPAWCNYDGTQKVYPRTVRFNESFAKYKGLTSTSF